MRAHGTALWQGFDIEWANTPHRLKHLTSALEGLQADEAGIRGTVRSRLTVGQVPDRGVVRTRVAGLRGAGLHFVDGEVAGFAEAAPGEKARFHSAPVTVDVRQADPDCATAVLRGFELACTSHPGGIHPQGLSIGLTELEVVDGRVSFVPRAWVRASNSPDPVTTWRTPFRFEIRVLYTVIAGRDAAITHRAEPCVRAEHDRRTRGPLTLQATHRGHGGFSQAAVGLRGFRWDQRHRSWFDRNGRFIRRLQAQVEAHEYDPATGETAIRPALWFSNDGLLPWPARSEHRLWTTLIETRGPGPLPAPLTVEQPVRTGLEPAPLEHPFALGSPASIVA